MSAKAYPGISPSETQDALLRLALTRLTAIEELLHELIRERRPIEQDDPVAEMVERLRAACFERNIQLSCDDHIRESAAALLLSRSPSTLRNWRHAARPLPCRLWGGRIEYSLRDLAQHLLANEEEEW